MRATGRRRPTARLHRDLQRRRVLSDFLKDGPGTLLDSNLAFALDTYLLPGLPVVTPNDAIESDLYSSPRFGWAPVLSYVDLNASGRPDYPILTFRPVFLDNGSAPAR